ncbi:MAG: PaaI family thioesterase [Acidimicrobiales bacterium]
MTKPLWPAEPVEALLGIEPVTQSDTGATVELAVVEEHANDHQICHGGIIFLLADAAMGRASNTSVSSLASHAEIDFLSAVPLGSRLRATAELRRHRRKLRIWDVSVAIVGIDGSAEIIAEFRGRTIQIADQ